MLNKHHHSRCGHYPGHLRDEFIEALEEYLVGEAESPNRLITACGAVWGCTDIVPNDYFTWAEDISGLTVKSRTYAALARGIRAALRDTPAALGTDVGDAARPDGREVMGNAMTARNEAHGS